jgi:8-oxo-dGTP pyrophosphatase MutT (NUDIX family)
MLLFHCTEEDALARIRREGLPAGSLLWTSYEAAKAACAGALLVVDPLRFDPSLFDTPARQVTSGAVPSNAIRNLDPYLLTEPVAAGGGYVVRPGTPDPEVLLIFRRGVWDVPKGKQDDGESIEACALREVREEVGIHDLSLLADLGTTVHGYERGGAYHVKTTYWYLMQTPETDFTPQAEEAIEQVAWMPWSEALEHIGYETFRRHMHAVEEQVRHVLHG